MRIRSITSCSPSSESWWLSRQSTLWCCGYCTSSRDSGKYWAGGQARQGTVLCALVQAFAQSQLNLEGGGTANLLAGFVACRRRRRDQRTTEGVFWMFSVPPIQFNWMSASMIMAWGAGQVVTYRPRLCSGRKLEKSDKFHELQLARYCRSEEKVLLELFLACEMSEACRVRVGSIHRLWISWIPPTLNFSLSD